MCDQVSQSLNHCPLQRRACHTNLVAVHTSLAVGVPTLEQSWRSRRQHKSRYASGLGFVLPGMCEANEENLGEVYT